MNIIIFLFLAQIFIFSDHVFAQDISETSQKRLLLIEIGGRSVKPNLFNFNNKLINSSTDKKETDLLHQLENSSQIDLQGCPQVIVSKNISEQVRKIILTIRSNIPMEPGFETNIIASSGVVNFAEVESFNQAMLWATGRTIKFITPLQETQYRLRTLLHNLKIENYPSKRHLLIDIGSSSINIGIIENSRVTENLSIPYGTRTTAQCNEVKNNNERDPVNSASTTLWLDQIDKFINKTVANNFTPWISRLEAVNTVVVVGGAPFMYFKLGGNDASGYFLTDTSQRIEVKRINDFLALLRSHGKPLSPAFVFKTVPEQYAALKWMHVILSSLQSNPNELTIAFPKDGGSDWILGYGLEKFNFNN